MSVLQIRASVTGGLHHPLSVKNIVLLQAVGQVGVFNGSQGDIRSRVRLGLVEQIRQRHCATLTSLERTAIRAKHHAVADVLGLDVVRQEPGHSGHLEKHFKVMALAHVGDVNNAVGLEFAHATTNRSEIGGVISEATVPLTHDHWGILPLDENAQCAVVLDGQAVSHELVHNPRQVVVVAGLAGHVLVRQQHRQTGVGGVEPLQGDVNESTPDPQSLGVPTLQFDNATARTVSKLRVSIESLLGILVELLDTGQVEIFDVHPFLDDVLNEHAELGAPVTDVILWDNGVPLSAQDTVEAVADDGGT